MTPPRIIRAASAPRSLVVLGQPVAHSLSPIIQNAALQAAELSVTYGRREVATDGLSSVVHDLCASGTGGNVTMPHKAAMRRLAARVTSVARRTGAVNTFWWEGQELVGHNTDVDGVRATVRALCPRGVPGDVVVLGAGGSAAAVLVALEEWPRDGSSAQTLVAARTSARAAALVAQLGSSARVTGFERIDWSRVGLVVNATPAGMGIDDPHPVPVAVLESHTAVFDLVYRRDGTSWVRAARAQGLVAEDGLRMLVEQGAAAFECWFDIPAPRDVMWRALGEAAPSAEGPRA